MTEKLMIFGQFESNVIQNNMEHKWYLDMITVGKLRCSASQWCA